MSDDGKGGKSNIDISALVMPYYIDEGGMGEHECSSRIGSGEKITKIKSASHRIMHAFGTTTYHHDHGS